MPFIIDDIIIGSAIAAAVGGTAAGVGSWLGGKQQASAAKDAAKRAALAGEQSNDILSGSRGEEIGQINNAAQYGVGRYDQALAALQQNQTDLRDIYAQERGVGASALQRMNDVILGGNIDALQMDPAYAFRQAQGEKALQRQASAAGSFGSGANLKDFMQFNQDLASTEYNNAISRLMGLTAIGQQANANYAGQTQQNAANIANTYGAQGNFYNQNRMAMANALANNSMARANALTGNASNVNAMNLQAANATAQGYAGVANAAQGVTNNLATLWLLNGGWGGTGGGAQQPAPANAYGASITTRLPGQSFAAPAYPQPMPLESYFTPTPGNVYGT